MSKIKSPIELKRLKEEMQSKTASLANSESPERKVQIKLAMATCGIASGARDVMEFMETALEKRGIEALVTQTGCMGYCYAEPSLEVTLPGKQPVVFGFVDLRKADQIIEKYIKLGEIVDGIIPVNYLTIDQS